MESYQSPRSLGTCVSSHSPVQLENTEDLRTSLQQVSPANRSALPESEREQTTSATCGPLPFASLEKCGPHTSYWRTSQACFPDLTGTLDKFSETWPRAGMMLDGGCYRRQKWERRIKEIGCGLLLPTLTASDHIESFAVKPRVNPARGGKTLGEWLTFAPTPSFAERWMGWPIGWTDLKPLAMDKFQQWLRQFGGC